ncbi:hypothetical protein HK104_003455 [Borealophlyctis nickersoniae]|nr:hypothetical protein HK104_003455 [Borealophlyctis nickersoniae]
MPASDKQTTLTRVFAPRKASSARPRAKALEQATKEQLLPGVVPEEVLRNVSPKRIPKRPRSEPKQKPELEPEEHAVKKRKCENETIAIAEVPEEPYSKREEQKEQSKCEKIAEKNEPEVEEHLPVRYRPPSSVPRPVVTITAQTPTPRIPFHYRYRPLVDPGVNLPLPSKYQLLGCFFDALDTVLSHMKGRNQPSTFDKIQTSVAIVTKRNFELRHLAQIMTVMPEAYTLECRRPDRRLHVDFPSTATSSETMSNPLSASSPSVTFSGTLAGPQRAAIDDAKLAARAQLADANRQARQRVFNGRLLDAVKRTHSIFLKTLPDSPEIEGAELKAWHPEFCLENVPDVEPAQLPVFESIGADFVQQNATRSTSLTTSIAANPKIFEPKGLLTTDKDVEQNRTKPLPDPKVEDAKELVKTVETAKTPSRVADILAKLKEKKKREIRNKMYKMPSTPAETRRHAMLSRLHTVARSIKSHFVLSKTSVLPVSSIADNLSINADLRLTRGKCCAWLLFTQPDNAREYVELLAEVCPDLAEINKGKYVGPTLKVKLDGDWSGVKAAAEEAKGRIGGQ